MYWSSRVVTFRLNSKNSMTDVSVTLRPPCLCPEGHQHGVSIQSSITSPNNARMKNRTDLNLGEVICITILSYPRFLSLFIEWLRQGKLTSKREVKVQKS